MPQTHQWDFSLRSNSARNRLWFPTELRRNSNFIVAPTGVYLTILYLGDVCGPCSIGIWGTSGGETGNWSDRIFARPEPWPRFQQPDLRHGRPWLLTQSLFVQGEREGRRKIRRPFYALTIVQAWHSYGLIVQSHASVRQPGSVDILEMSPFENPLLEVSSRSREAGEGPRMELEPHTAWFFAHKFGVVSHSDTG